MDSVATDSFMHGVEWVLALGGVTSIAAWGFSLFARLFEKAIR